MGARAQALADEFDGVVADLAKTIEDWPEDKWGAICGPEGWTVAATAQHVAGQFYAIEYDYLKAGAELRPWPDYDWDYVNRKNDARAAANTDASKADVLALLRADAAKMSSFVRGLSDEQLDFRAPLPLANGAEVTTQQLIEGGVLIDHVRTHLKSIRDSGGVGAGT